MDKKEIWQNLIILPAILGVILSVFLCVYLNANVQRVLPVPKDTAFAYHDSSIIDEGENAEGLKPNTSIGSIEFDGTKLNLCYEADYSNLVGAVSFDEESTDFSKIGAAYLKTTSANASLIKKANMLNINSIYGSFKYQLLDELEFENEYQATIYAPKASKSLVIYYQNSNGTGLATTYKALVYKEVK